MPRLSLYLPVKPLSVNQAFGIYNPAYEPLGFTKHNGVDLAVFDGQLAYAMVNCIVVETGENKSAGKYVKIRTQEPVEAEGSLGIVVFMYMHGRRILCEKGEYLKAGDPIMECDNTGFSTGHHLHVSAFFVNASGERLRKGKKESDYCFDWMQYWNKQYAQNAQSIWAQFLRLQGILKRRVGL